MKDIIFLEVFFLSDVLLVKSKFTVFVLKMLQ